MAVLHWNPVKSKWLQMTRGASFEDLVERGKFLGMWDHPTRVHQRMMLFEYEEYVWAVPYVATTDGRFLKTLYPSRKFTRLQRMGRLR